MLLLSLVCVTPLALQMPGPAAAGSAAVRPSAFALKALRDLALVDDQLRELRAAVLPAAEQGYGAASDAPELGLLADTLTSGTGQLSTSLDSLQTAIKANGADGGKASTASKQQQPPVLAKSLKSLTAEASRLHQLVDEERQLLLILEEQESGSASRTRAAFDQIDINGDGELSFAEFEAGAKALLASGSDDSLLNELRARFTAADVDQSDTLCYEEFVALIGDLKGEALGPLRRAFTAGLVELLGVSLQMIARTLASELAAIDSARPGRAQQLAIYVDIWCDIESDAACLIDSHSTNPEGGGGAVGAPGASAAAPAPVSGVVVSSSSSSGAEGPDGELAGTGVVVQTTSASGAGDGAAASSDASAASSPDGAVAEQCETLLNRVGELAGQLSLPNATTANEGLARRAVLQLSFALNSAKSALGFCARGFSILGRDIREVFALTLQLVRGGGLQPKDWALVKRVGVDLVALVPYTIIMVVPLSPPGHVFAFSLMNRCFPNAIPSCFTAQRQDIYEIYSRIASEAVASEASLAASTTASAAAAKLNYASKALKVASGAAAGARKVGGAAIGAAGRVVGFVARRRGQSQGEEDAPPAVADGAS